MKILLLSNMYPSEESFAGIFVKNQFQKIKSCLDKSEDEIEILYMKRRFTNFIGSVIKYMLFFFRSIKFFFKKYDVVHVHYFFPLGIIGYLYSKIRPECKVVVTFHGSDVYNFMSYDVINFFFKRIAEDTDVLIAVGKDLGEEVEEKLDLKPDYILSAGVDKNIFYLDKNNEKQYDFLFVGSFISRKGVDLLCQAIEKKGDKNISYCFVGTGPLEKKIKKTQNKGYDIKIMRNKTQDELRTIYNQAKWFLFPSKNEAFGLVVTESIFCGTPVVVSRVGGIKEQVDDGYNGYFLDSVTVKSIIEIINNVNQLNSEKYLAMRQNCLKSNSEYSLSKVCKNLLEIYRS